MVRATWALMPVMIGLGAHQPHRLGGLEQVVGHPRVHHRHAGDVDDHHARLLVHHPGEERLHDLVGAVAVDGAHERQEQHAVVHAMTGVGQLADGGLVPGHGVRGSRRCRCRWPGTCRTSPAC
jgi:hypothetical protein